MPQNEQDKLEKLIHKARKSGADAVDVIYFSGQSQSISYRMGKLEDVERSESTDLGIRVLIGKRQAIVSSGDMTPATLDTLVERAIDMAKNAPEDPHAGLADKALLAQTWPELDLYDDHILDAETLKDMARHTEEVALQVEGITNSEGAGAGTSSGEVTLLNSDGFHGTYRSSNFSVSVSLIAGEGAQMERDYDWSSKRHFTDLKKPEEIGLEAARRTLSRLGPRKVDTCRVPVVFDPRVSRTLLGHLGGAINGAAIARGTSFLKECMEEQIFPENINISDDPHIVRGPSSKPFDSEGVKNGPLEVVTGGVLKNWMLSSSAAHQLGLQSNGRASRGTSSPPSPGTTNLYMAAGEVSPEELMSGIKDGFYVTELIGMGVNGLTGDYSRGAGGFWIENGKITYPVSEITIASNLKDMYRTLIAADDLEIIYGTDAPTILIDNMMIAGN